MDRDANYIAVGAFTLLVIAMGVVFVMWYSDTGDRRNYMLYEMYFNGSVSGLSEGSPVRYLGVDVGTVRRISLNKDRPDIVKVTANVDASAPISADTRASLGLQGITGLLYINLKQVTNGGGELKQGERYPIIESQSSDIDAFIATLPQLAGRVTSLLDHIDTVFSNENVKALNETLTNLRDTSTTLPHAGEQVQQLLTQLGAAAQDIQSTANNINGLASEARPQVRDALEHLNTVSAQLASASKRLDDFLANSEAPLNHFTSQGLFEIERLLRDVRSAATEFRELSRSLKETPSQLLFERPETGVEIKP